MARNGLHGCSVIAGSEQSARNMTMPPARPRARRWCRRNGRRRDWRPRAARRGRRSRRRPCGPSVSASRCRKSSSSDWKGRCRRESVRSQSLSPNLASKLRIVEFAAYQTSVFWHQAMKAVAPQTSPRAAIDWMAQRRSAAPFCGTDDCPRRRHRRDYAAARPDRPRRRRLPPPAVQGLCAQSMATSIGDRGRGQIVVSVDPRYSQ